VNESAERRRHWDATYGARGPSGVSWYEPQPRISLELVQALGVGPEIPVIDIGGGASLLADSLLERGFLDVTVLDLSAVALEEVRKRLAGQPVELVQADVLAWRPPRAYGLWHDRALFHFLVAEDERRRYLDRLREALPRGGCVIVGTFAPDAPPTCSGLPVTRYGAADLALTLGPHFELVEARHVEHRTPRGTAQPFTWLAGRVRAH
jgi:hypothetical protein